MDIVNQSVVYKPIGAFELKIDVRWPRHATGLPVLLYLYGKGSPLQGSRSDVPPHMYNAIHTWGILRRCPRLHQVHSRPTRPCLEAPSRGHQLTTPCGVWQWRRRPLSATCWSLHRSEATSSACPLPHHRSSRNLLHDLTRLGSSEAVRGNPYARRSTSGIRVAVM
jgi:hypothetical protein